MRLEWESARDAQPMDAWGTITLIVVATVLSVQEFQGADFTVLHTHYESLPQEPWRYLSSAVLHGGWLHLGMNAMWLLRLGIVAEALLGLYAYSVLAVVLGAASIASQWALSGSCVGLSGIVYGIFGLLWALDRWHPRCRGVIDKGTTEAFAAWFLICLMITWAGMMPIGNTAHAAGFFIGALSGWSLSVVGIQRLVRLSSVLLLLLVIAAGQVPLIRGVINRSEAYEYELFNRGVDALQAEEYDLALDLYEDLTRRAPGLSEAWNNLAVTLQQLGRMEEAMQAGARADQAAGADPQ